MEVSLGYTPDISQFRFYFYEPIWYFDPRIKLPQLNLFKARYLAVAESCGDAMTYYILTEPEDIRTKRQVLVRSVIKSRQKHTHLPRHGIRQREPSNGIVHPFIGQINHEQQAILGVGQ